MSNLDTYYRALLEYCGITSGDPEIGRFCETVREVNSDHERLESVRSVCEIDVDWVEEIERQMPYVEKAVRAERQFITQNGEVIPIEKVKHVSKTTVTHLARHSNLIATPPEPGEDLIPERLFVEEKLSDYAVYENRFLYLLLCTLRDFIGLRLQRIEELGTYYRSKMRLKKEFRLQKRYILFDLKFEEENAKDPYSVANEKILPIIERIRDQQRIVHALLNTPLMKDVAKAPMLRPPITRTNVLKMNVDFKACLALYDFLVAYTKDGYRITEERITHAPFGSGMAKDYAQLIALSSFLSYEYGNNFSGMLRENLDADRERQRRKKREQMLVRVEQLRARSGENGQSLAEFISALEEQNRQLRRDSLRLDEVSDQLVQSGRIIGELRSVEKELHARVAERDDLLAQRDREMDDAERRHEDALREAEDTHARLLTEERQRMTDERRELETQMQEEIDRERERGDGFAAACDRIAEEKRMTLAQLHGLRERDGLNLPEEDFTSRERFDELEMEYLAFLRFFARHWKNAKRRIRKDILHSRLYPVPDEPENESTGRWASRISVDEEQKPMSEEPENESAGQASRISVDEEQKPMTEEPENESAGQASRISVDEEQNPMTGEPERENAGQASRISDDKEQEPDTGEMTEAGIGDETVAPDAPSATPQADLREEDKLVYGFYCHTGGNDDRDQPDPEEHQNRQTTEE